MNGFFNNPSTFLTDELTSVHQVNWHDRRTGGRLHRRAFHVEAGLKWRYLKVDNVWLGVEAWEKGQRAPYHLQGSPDPWLEALLDKSHNMCRCCGELTVDGLAWLFYIVDSVKKLIRIV
ncbi:hypothetical protein T265_05306 [Opisthorchis viverrini]|uniref:Uncharacterized protein n=1 Tax=Opisthorchis viverrini TaxID=6198 RepID=A0A074ZPF8_OPIVI|nr:hypothetical protein T265_05306 [Opisthorchis viverrini]KER27672.1 hypothetical protein T265_05306 [Opisthorchis viverrini]